MASHHRLSITLKQRSTLTPLAFHPVDIPTHSPLIVLIDNIYFLPLNFRKFILTVCRVQKQISSNLYLSAECAGLPDTVALQVETKTSPRFHDILF